MPRLPSYTPLLRSLAAPRAVTCRQRFRFSTATRLCAEQPISPPESPSKPTAPSQAPPAAPSLPRKASRAADLAAAEATTESDSAQPPEPKPELPSQRSNSAISQPSPSKADAVPTPTPPTSNPSKPRTASAISIELPPPRYHVSRSASKNLPIYTDYKRGGNLHLTTVRKITGDLSALRDELRVYLNKKNEDVKINSLTGHVVVKGHCTGQIKSFLEARGM